MFSLIQTLKHNIRRLILEMFENNVEKDGSSNDHWLITENSNEKQLSQMICSNIKAIKLSFYLRNYFT